jgi:putative transposase
MNYHMSSFGPSTKLKIGNKDIKLIRLVENVWQAEEIKTGLFTQLPVDKLLDEYAQGNVTFPERPMLSGKNIREENVISLDCMPASLRELVIRRRSLVENIIRDYGEKPPRTLLQHAIEKYSKHETKAPSISTVTTWITRYRNSGKSILSLTPRYHMRGNTKSKMDSKVRELCLDALNRGYLTQSRTTMQATLAISRALVTKENGLRLPNEHLKLPTLSTLQSVLASIPRSEQLIARYGANAARVMLRNSIHDAEVNRPYARYEIDHTRLDIILVGENTGLIIGRPWLTLVVDKKTKVIAGFHLTMDPPSAQSLAAALKHAIMPKCNLSEEVPGLKHDWPVFGKPMLVAVDHGMEFHSQEFQDACLQLGIQVAIMPRKTPWWKGTVERTLGTINRGVTNIAPAGRTFASISEKVENQPHKNAAITLSTMRKCLVRWIVDVYHQTPHRGLPTSPYNMWKDLVSPEDALLPEDIDIFTKISGVLTTRKLFHYGIELNHIKYNSPQLGIFRTSNGPAKELKVRWDTQNLGSIMVYVNDHTILKVPAADKYAAVNGCSLTMWSMARADIINRMLDPADESSINEALLRIQEDFDEDAQRSRKNLKAHKRAITKQKKTKDVKEQASTDMQSSIAISTASPGMKIKKAGSRQIPSFTDISTDETLDEMPKYTPLIKGNHYE